MSNNKSRFDVARSDSSMQVDREGLSALMDGEAGELELRRLVRNVSEHPELLATWKRYQLVSAAAHGQAHGRPGVDLLTGINDAIADDPIPTREQRRFAKLFRLAGQGAIAASVALFAVVGVNSLQVAKREGAAAQALANAASAVPELAGEYNPSGLERTVRLDSAARTRLQQAVYQFSSTSSDAPSQLIYELPQREPLAPVAGNQAP